MVLKSETMHTKKLFFPILSLLLAGVVLLTLSTCKKNNDEDQNTQLPPVYTNGERVI